MMRAPNAAQRDALLSMQRHGAQWEIVIEWLRQCHERARDECVRADDDVHVRRAQGEARCIGALLDILTIKP
jgi:hypothetical protein